jgi:hypothetical protein
MNIHFCTEDPCPLREKEIADILNNGCDVSYTKTKDLFYDIKKAISILAKAGFKIKRKDTKILIEKDFKEK